jgi:hypothetical protein
MLPSITFDQTCSHCYIQFHNGERETDTEKERDTHRETQREKERQWKA